VNDFVEQCRREWRRLRVPDAVADEMAADLAADLKEAQAEGASAEEVLGSAAGDPRSFAASWAAERAVIPPPRLAGRLSRRSLVLTATAALTVVAAIGAALVIFASPDASPPTVAIGLPPEFGSVRRPPEAIRILAVPPPTAFASPTAPGGVWIDSGGRAVLLAEANDPGVEINRVGATLLIVGLVGIVPALLLLFWSSRFDNLRSRPT
jgi:hypothetical protein